MSEFGIDMDALHLIDDAIQEHDDGRLCPFCGMIWDQAVLDRAAEEGPAALAAALSAIYNEPVNATGDDLGTRAATEQDDV